MNKNYLAWAYIVGECLTLDIKRSAYRTVQSYYQYI